jgi:DNA-binding HxlR family transcriptional regulator
VKNRKPTNWKPKDRKPLPPDMFDELCPSSLLPFRFGDHKWAALIIRCLEDGPRRFSELRVPLQRVTPKMLTQSLRGLERDGLVSRTVHTDPNLRVEYALTPLGRSMLKPLEAACEWAAEHWDELLDAREHHTAMAETGQNSGNEYQARPASSASSRMTEPSIRP